jgi:hypothetical protein
MNRADLIFPLWGRSAAGAEGASDMTHLSGVLQ